MKIVVCGGDGFCGWPSALELLDAGHEIIIVDSLVRRQMDCELGVESLTPIASIKDRINAAQSFIKPAISFFKIDLRSSYDEFLALLVEYSVDAVVHFAEQRSAPYSMKSSFHRRYTVDNNINVTHNILSAIVDSGLDIHLLHLGTMGVYGYNTIGSEIPEGYLDISVKEPDMEGQVRSILYPADPGSIYHMTKVQDQTLFYFYNKNYGIRVTDLHQGIVWGTNTQLTSINDLLVNRFDYDGDFGTVLNRFLMQAARGYPLTVHGSGGQQRAFINIKDAVCCIKLALENPPKNGERVRIFNQATEVHSVLALAKIVAEITGCQIKCIENPRVESESNILRMKFEALIELGLKPTLLNEGLLAEIILTAKKYPNRVNEERILSVSKWR